jgi:hypothetical protein
MPAKAGIQSFLFCGFVVYQFLETQEQIPAYAGMTARVLKRLTAIKV